eukprot:CAMPEP_0198729068 /NCGR_PEP_ID=MMETSP1475-20131203/14445_1 /TAXON_ID= ORGANISM="Unidentified sp., Strain CCMP1999" /NCGR_SAMPLE_ID=MMETSP1475 /ASSEMBLY_ACC=CAM_ASM_001111 /LENGTH=349 /DNA_ID=CAMNT_0044491627 /DNA_START=189 /DNA_END=1238 /DNA_ORIENTATION=+
MAIRGIVRASSNGKAVDSGRVKGLRVGITGATGFIGKNVVRTLRDEGAETIFVLTRNLTKAQSTFPKSLYPCVQFVPFDSSQRVKGPDQDLQEQLQSCQAVVNLAGESIADGRWSLERKQQIRDSRINGTARLVSILKHISQTSTDVQPKLISASAVGYYGISDFRTFDESSPPGDDFLAQIAKSWEAQALQASSIGIPTTILRIGVVMGKGGGALQKLVPVFNAFVGGPVGSGNQWVSWVHMDDVVNVIVESMVSDNYTGVLNVTAPKPERFSDVCQELARILNRPSWLRVPGSVLSVILGEAAQLVIAGQRVLPRALLDRGYKFQHPDLRSAFRSTFRNADELLTYK